MYAQIAHSVLVRRVRVSLGRARIGVATALLLAVGASLSCREAHEGGHQSILSRSRCDSASRRRKLLMRQLASAHSSTACSRNRWSAQRPTASHIARLASSWDVERQLPHARAQDPRRLEVSRRHAGRQQVHQGLPHAGLQEPERELQERHADRRSPWQRRRHQVGSARGAAPR